MFLKHLQEKNPKKICWNKPSLKKKLHCEKNLYLSNALLGKARLLGGGPSSTASIGTCTSSFPDIIIKSLHNKSTFSKRLSFISDCCALPSRNTRWTDYCMCKDDQRSGCHSDLRQSHRSGLHLPRILLLHIGFTHCNVTEDYYGIKLKY